MSDGRCHCRPRGSGAAQNRAHKWNTLDIEAEEQAIIVHQSIQQGQGILGTGVVGKHLQAALAHKARRKSLGTPLDGLERYQIDLQVIDAILVDSLHGLTRVAQLREDMITAVAQRGADATLGDEHSHLPQAWTWLRLLLISLLYWTQSLNKRKHQT